MTFPSLTVMPQHVDIGTSADVILARQCGKQAAAALGLGIMDQTRFATAISELCRNALIHAGGGRCTVTDASDVQFIRVSATVSDSGPGIADLQLALTDRHSSVGSMGLGLPGARRLVDTFQVNTGVAGTQVVIAMVRRRRLPA